jgi:single-strand DNA-binding protein
MSRDRRHQANGGGGQAATPARQSRRDRRVAAAEFWRIAMLNEAQVSLTGYVATQPLIRTVKTGVTTVSMRVAWTPRRRDRVTGEWADGNTSYVTVNCWRKLASHVAICVRKGDPVAIQGRLTIRSFVDKEDRERIAVEIEASSVGHDLNQGVSEFRRIRPQTGMTAAEFAAAQSSNGQGANGQGANGQGGNGQGANGQGANGQGANGQGADERGAYGHGEIDQSHGGGDAGAAWADAESGIPMPAEPDHAFFDDSVIDEGVTQEPLTVAS